MLHLLNGIFPVNNFQRCFLCEWIIIARKLSKLFSHFANIACWWFRRETSTNMTLSVDLRLELCRRQQDRRFARYKTQRAVVQSDRRTEAANRNESNRSWCGDSRDIDEKKQIETRKNRLERFDFFSFYIDRSSNVRTRMCASSRFDRSIVVVFCRWKS